MAGPEGTGHSSLTQIDRESVERRREHFQLEEIKNELAKYQFVNSKKWFYIEKLRRENKTVFYHPNYHEICFLAYYEIPIEAIGSQMGFIGEVLGRQELCHEVFDQELPVLDEAQTK